MNAIVKNAGKDFWKKYEKQVSYEMFTFLTENCMSPISEITFVEIMKRQFSEEVPKAMKSIGANWSDVYQYTRNKFGFWEKTIQEDILSV